MIKLYVVGYSDSCDCLGDVLDVKNNTTKIFTDRNAAEEYRKLCDKDNDFAHHEVYEMTTSGANDYDI